MSKETIKDRIFAYLKAEDCAYTPQQIAEDLKINTSTVHAYACLYSDLIDRIRVYKTEVSRDIHGVFYVMK